MTDAMDRITAAVTNSNAGVDSAIALITGVAAQLKNAGGNAIAISALADSLDAESVKLAHLVVADAPPPPDVAPAPAPVPALDPVPASAPAADPVPPAA